MNLYKISRTRLVTEVFVVPAETEEEAFIILGNGDEPGDFDKVSESTHSSESEVLSVDAYFLDDAS